MAGTSDFQSWAEGAPGLNLMALATYVASTARTNGVAAGLADQTLYNRAARQSAAISKLIGDFIAAQGFNCLDDGNDANRLTALEAALTAYVGGAITVNSQVIWGGTSAGSANAHALTTTPTLTALAAPTLIFWVAGFSNTGATTLAIDAIAGTKAVTKRVAGGIAALTGGEISAGEVMASIYDGTQHQLILSVGNQVVWVREQQALNSNSADTMTINTWTQRTLTTAKLNEVTGASLSGNRVTLPPGTYEVMISAPLLVGGSITTLGRARLYNFTAGGVIIEGQTLGAFMGNSTSSNMMAKVVGKFTLAVSSALEVDCISNQASLGGAPSNLGTVEVYTEAYFRKVS